MDLNEQAKKELAEGKKRAGFPSKEAMASEDEDETQDMGDLEDDETESEKEEEVEEEEEEAESETDEETSESDESEEDDEDEDADDEDEEEDDSEPSNRKKLVPRKFLDKEKAKRNKWKTKFKETQALLDKALSDKADIESQLPDDLDKYADELAKEIGVEDPENLKKIFKVMKQVTGKDNEALTKKITDLEAKLKDQTKGNDVKAQEEGFNNEWSPFESTFKKEYPNATTEQIAQAKKLMNDLSHTPGIGGVTFTDKDGVERIKGYSFKYIFSENKEDFEALVTIKKKKGMETGRSQGATKDEDFNKPTKLTPKSSASDIRKRAKEMSDIESGNEDGLTTPENREI